MDADKKNTIQPVRTAGGADGAELGETKTLQLDHSDIGFGLYQEALQINPVEREQIAKTVKLKLDRILLPLMCIAYLLGFLDKASLNYANAYGLQADLGLHGNEYSWVAAISNFGYLAFAYPSTLILQKWPIGKFVSCAAEACIAPAWMLLTGMFWTRQEQPFRMAWWLGCNGIAQIAGAGIAWGLGNKSGPVASWKLIFVTIGAMSFGYGLICLFILPSTPSDFYFFNHQETVVAVWRIADNQTGVKHGKILRYQIKEALTDPKVFFIAGAALSLGIVNGAVQNFMTTLLKSFGYSNVKSVEYQMPAGAFQLIPTIGFGLLNSYIPNFLIVSISFGFLIPLAGMIGIATIPLRHQLALTACAWLQPVAGVAIILSWTLVSSNIAGHTKRMFVNGLEFVLYATGNIIGVESAGILFTVLMGLWMWRENRRRDRNAGQQPKGAEAGFLDHTDLENQAFRYKLRRRKVKCDGQRPACQTCQTRQDDCEYPATLLPGGYSIDIMTFGSPFPQQSRPAHSGRREGTDSDRPRARVRRDGFQQRLLEVFWSTHHSVELCACIHRPSFETEYSEPENEFLMCAISSLSAIYLSDDEARTHTGETTAASLSSSYAERAREFSRTTSDNPTISTIQANLILGLRDLLQRSISSGWMYIGHSIRMSQAMRLRREFNQRLRPREKERRRRTFWACVIMDRLASYWCNRPPTIQLDAISIRLPMAEAAYAFDEESTVPTLEAVFQGTNFESLSGLLQHFCVAAVLWGQLAGEYAIGGRATAKASPMNPLTDNHRFHCFLLEYHRRLPASLRWSSASYRAHRSLGQGQTFVNLHLVLHHGLFVIQQEYLPQLDPFGNVDRMIGDAGCDRAGVPFNHRDEDVVTSCLENTRAIISISQIMSSSDDQAIHIFQSTFAASALMSAAQVCLWGHFVEQYPRENSQRTQFRDWFTFSLEINRRWSSNWKVCEGFVESLELLEKLYECAYGTAQIPTDKIDDNSNQIMRPDASSQLSEGAGLPDPTTTNQRLYYQIRAISVLSLEDKNFKRRCLAAFTKAMWPDIVGDDVMEAFLLTELDEAHDLGDESIFPTFQEDASEG
ncbi:hypothetical protein TCE0_042f14773 [Talaromyces pinophilus]|uniref:Zn(2)-C6 fungal-type domain-containing protein n=1 Tax=Talaromyces pinophilus TaxID=128442 RepID=A0A6V8HKT7_TALPI|nr:hypothetical protein TCE0_042f14773 [Talaromyces pinophilus]